MFIKKWDQLPDQMKNVAVKGYYNDLENKIVSLYTKRIFDYILAIVLTIFLFPLFICIAILIKTDSKGPIFFRQIRVTQYGKQFIIYKFRTMVHHADKIGAQVTTKDDPRVTSIGRFLRKTRLDELPQLMNVIKGEMSFVGTRPEVVKYVEQYTDEMLATLLLPAGITSNTSLEFKDEEKMLENANDVDRVYVEKILPEKMKVNLNSLKSFSLMGDLRVLLKTLRVLLLVFGKPLKLKGR